MFFFIRDWSQHGRADAVYEVGEQIEAQDKKNTKTDEW
jgi:hypothetical protein